MKKIIRFLFALVIVFCGLQSYATDVGSQPLPYGINSVNEVEVSGLGITVTPEQLVVQNRQVECIDYGLLDIDLIGEMNTDVGQQNSIVSCTQVNNNNSLNFSQSGNSFVIRENKLIVSNLVDSYKYAAVTRKFLMTNTGINLYLSAATNSNLIDDPCWFKSWARNQKVS